MEPLPTAESLIAEHFPGATAAFLGGSVLTARRTPTSDLDVVVVQPEQGAIPYRSTVRYRGWLVELFVHGAESLRHYWDLDTADRRAALLRMVAEGHVLAGGPAAEAIRAEATGRLAAGPPAASPADLEAARYRVTDLLDDLVGCPHDMEISFVAAALLAAAADLELLRAGAWSGAGKWLGRELAAVDADLAGRLTSAHRATLATGTADPLRAVVTEVLDRAGGPLSEGYQATGSVPER